VQYYRIENHGHLWPGGDTGGKKINDESGRNATAIIANFFAQL
jgi:poly(3-hydroxybutyrate) depolymerase